MKIIGINLSNSPNSIGYAMLSDIMEYLWGEVVNFADTDFPLFKMGDAEPAGLESLCNRIKDADKIVFTTPEFNGSFSPFGKNVLDQISVKGTFDGSEKHTALSTKPTLLIAVAPGPLGGIRAINPVSNVLTELGCVIVNTYATTGGFQAHDYDYTNAHMIADTFKTF